MELIKNTDNSGKLAS